MNRLLVFLLLVVLAYAAALRLACVGAEFWLDEIWSWGLAHDAPSFLGVLAIRHDNSHPLNSLWLRLWPASAPLVVLRLPALLAGLGAVVLAAYVARRRGTAESVFAAILVAACSWTVFASAEARGYSLAILFAFAALEALWGYLDGRSRRSLVAFWLLSALGFLSHLTFVHAYIGFVIWSMRRFARERPDSLRQIRAMLLLHGPVAAFFAAYYLFAVRGMDIGGGTPDPLADVLRNLISLGLGGPADAYGWLVVGVAVVVFVGGLSLLARGRAGSASDRSVTPPRDLWTFFAVAIVGSPALFLIRPPAYIAERYFMVPFVFFLLLVAFVFGDLWRSAVPLRTQARLYSRTLILLMLVAFLAGNAYQVRTFVEAGRGEFGEALAWIAEQDAGDRILITGEHDFRVRLYVEFYARRQSLSRVRYLIDKEDTAATWLLFDRATDDPRHALTEIETIDSARFTRVKASPSRGRACWGWHVYRRTDASR